MNLNALQKYFLKIYVILILFFTFCVPTMVDGNLSYGFVFIENSVSEVVTSYLVIEFVGITLATIALVLATKDVRKK
jgi:hypothetical protein